MKKSLILVGVISALVFLNWLILGDQNGEREPRVDSVPYIVAGVRQAESASFEPVPEMVRSAMERRELQPAGLPHSEEFGGIKGLVSGWKEAGPVPDASVVAYGIGEPHVTTTDDKGAFQFDFIAPGNYRLAIHAAHWEPVLLEDLEITAGRREYLKVVLESGLEFLVDVGFNDQSGARVPVRGAQVSLFSGGYMSAAVLSNEDIAQSALRALTNFEGLAHFTEGTPGLYYCSVSASGFAPWTGEVSLNGVDGSILVDLDQGFSIEGLVIDSLGGAPEGATVFLSPHESRRDDSQSLQSPPRNFYYKVNSVRVDSSGRFKFEGMPPGEHHLAAVLWNGETAITEDPVSTGEVEPAFVTLRATGLATVRGFVMDSASMPVEGAKVYASRTAYLHPNKGLLVSEDTEAIEHVQRSTFSDASGAFELVGVRTAAGRIKVAATSEGHSKDSVGLDISPDDELDIVLTVHRMDSSVGGELNLPPGTEGSVSLIVSVGSGPLQGEKFSARLEGAEQWSIPLPSIAEDLTVKVYGNRLSPPCTGEPASYSNVNPGRLNMDFIMKSKTILTGRVVGDEGRPARSFEVSLFNDFEQEFNTFSVLDSENGQFEIPFNPEEDLFLTVSSPGFVPVEVWGLERKQGKEILVQLTERGEPLVIRVLDAEGNPVIGALVTVSFSGAEGIYPPSSQFKPYSITDSNGRCHLKNAPVLSSYGFIVSPGQVGLIPVAYFEDQQPASGDGEITLRLLDCEKVQLRFIDRSGNSAEGRCMIVDNRGIPLEPRAIPDIRHLLTSEAETVFPLEGGLLETNLPVGRYRLYLYVSYGFANDVQMFDFTVEKGASDWEFTVD